MQSSPKAKNSGVFGRFVPNTPEFIVPYVFFPLFAVQGQDSSAQHSITPAMPTFPRRKAGRKYCLRPSLKTMYAPFFFFRSYIHFNSWRALFNAVGFPPMPAAKQAAARPARPPDRISVSGHDRSAVSNTVSSVFSLCSPMFQCLNASRICALSLSPASRQYSSAHRNPASPS